MDQNIAQQERRRQIQDQKRRKRRQRMIQRNVILFLGLILIIFIVKCTIHVLVGEQRKDEVTVSNTQNALSESKKMPSDESQEQDETKTTSGEEELFVQKTQEELKQGNLILVNDQNPITEYSDEQLVEIGAYLQGVCNMKSKEIKLNEAAAKALKEMLEAFNEEVGENDLTVVSGYRDYNTQEALHYKSLQEETSSDIFVARPDRSEHHTGLAIDFSLFSKEGTSNSYDGTGIYEWINNNCYKYGFIMRYDTSKKDLTGIGYEPWHFRYVGKCHAQIMKELNLCLEEYIELLKGYTYYNHPGQGITKDTQNYSIYYVPSEGNVTNIPIPSSKKYDISGNNKDGFIVTVYLAE